MTIPAAIGAAASETMWALLADAPDDDWEHWRRTARPLQLGPVLRVDTTRPVDARAITAWIQAPERRSPPATI